MVKVSVLVEEFKQKMRDSKTMATLDKLKVEALKGRRGKNKTELTNLYEIMKKKIESNAPSISGTKKTHKMPDGKEMTGATHSPAQAKPVAKKKFKIKKKTEAPAQAKQTKEAPKKKFKIKKKANADGKLPNKKLKCFMLKAKNGAMYRTCATPEKKKQPKKQVRGKPRGGKIGGEKAYATVADRTKAEKGRAIKKRADKSGNLTITKQSGEVKRLKIKKPAKKKKVIIKKDGKVKSKGDGY